MAQSIEFLAFDVGSGHDLPVHGFEPRVGLWADRSLLGILSLSLSLSLSAPPTLSFFLSLFLKINK